MCGLVGVVTSVDVGVCLYDTLTVLQHRGQDAAGIMTSDNGKLNLRKDNGLIKDVFRTRHMRRLTGQMGIGHVRYPTAGSTSPALAQPFYVNSPYGLALAHNGNLTNTEELSRDLFKADLRHINTDSDSEVLLNVFAHELQCRGKIKPTPEDLFAAVSGVHDRCRGGFAAVVMITGYGILGFRDRNGIRPLVFGSRQTDNGNEYMIASESVALDSQGFNLDRDVAPGEAVFIDVNGNLHSKVCTEPGDHTPCIFEQVYFARPDSLMDGISVYKARLRMGEKLAEKLGIDAEVAGVLIDEGYTSLDEIAEAEADTLSQIEEFDSEMVDELQERAQDAQLVKALNDAEATEILLALEGVDEPLAAALVEAEILTVEALAELAIVELLEIQDIGNDNASAVIMAARENEGWFD